MESKRKTLVDINLTVWAGVKHFATIQDISVNKAVELLLDRGLRDYEYIIKKKVMSAGKSLATTQAANITVGDSLVMVDHTNSWVNNALHEHKKCAGKNCNKQGTIILEINYVHKRGIFCYHCATNLIAQNLAIKLDSNSK